LASIAVVAIGVLGAIPAGPASAAALPSRRLDPGAAAGFWTRARVRRALHADSMSGHPLPGAASARASSFEVLEATAPQYRTNGRIFGFTPHVGPYSCSGTSLATPSGSIVLTAGHCVYDEGRFGTHLIFIPSFAHEKRPFGTFVGTRTFVDPRWRKSEDSDYDVAAFEVEPNELGTLSTAVGAKSWTSSRSRFSELQIFGYPAGAARGEEMRSCVGHGLGVDRLDAPFGDPTLPAKCNLAPGSSGGAWLTEGGQLIDGVTSYGYINVPDRLYSPYFGTQINNFLGHLP
jgi:V8-like Glu-specific endopeptidase